MVEWAFMAGSLGDFFARHMSPFNRYIELMKHSSSFYSTNLLALSVGAKAVRRGRVGLYGRPLYLYL